MNSLQTIFRWMLLVWLVLVAALGFAVARSTHTTYVGNTMAFLFSSVGREKIELNIYTFKVKLKNHGIKRGKPCLVKLSGR